MLLIPRVSEKAYAQNIAGTYVFEVPMTATKAEIIKAIEGEFKDTKVKDVRLVVVKGKAKATHKSKRARPGVGKRSDWKKAYITLKKGKIEIAAFKSEETTEAKKAETVKKAEVEREENAGKAEVKKGGLFARRRAGRRGDK